jgi:serine protease DegS
MIRKLLPYFIQGLAIGVIGGLAIIVLLWLKPFQSQPVVEIKQAPASPTSSGAGQASYADAFAVASTAVVNIHTTRTIKYRRHPFFDDPVIQRFFGRGLSPREEQQTNLGSGVIVSEQGFVLTNNHVIEGADEIVVALNDGRNAVAAVVGTDPDTDVAVLRIQLDNLHSIVVGDSDRLRIGDVVLAIGNPFGVGQTVTQGIVSATGRNHLGLSTFENFIQTDAAINPGNSGGALINTRGELVGINTAIYSQNGGSQGIGFAIPSSLAQNVLTQLIEKGQVTRSWLGIDVQPLSPELAESFGLETTHGMLIAGVQHDSPGDKAGLQSGDIITNIAGKGITDATDALNQISQLNPGTAIALRVLRNNTELNIDAIVGARPQRE